jgi:HK97 family phage portal protein
VRYPNPDSTKFWGVAPLLALQDEVGIGKLAIHWNKNTLKDRGVTDVAFIFKDVDSESQWKLANKMVTERYANQGRKPWVLGGNAVVQPLSYSPVEMDWLRTIAFVDAKIASALGVPPLLVSSDTTSTHKNLEALQTEMWTNTILPLFRRITQRMTLYFRPVLGDNARIWIDENEIPALSLERKTRIESAEILNAMGFDAKDAAMSTNLGISRSATNELPKQQPANPKA